VGGGLGLSFVLLFLQSYNDFLQPLIYLNGRNNWTLALGLRALSYSDVDKSHPAYHLFLAYQQTKEKMARQGVTSSPNDLVGVDVSRL
jgi:ABC-type glycerol-3-phosphate transport system permease component